MSDPSIETLAAEIRQMRHDINQLIKKTPDSVSQWMPPRELARLLGVSSQTISAWRKEGRFRSTSMRPVQRRQRTDWEFHRNDAVDDALGLS